MCVLYVSFGSKVRPRTFGCVAMGSAVQFGIDVMRMCDFYMLCIGFTSLDVVCDELNYCAWNLDL